MFDKNEHNQLMSSGFMVQENKRLSHLPILAATLCFLLTFAAVTELSPMVSIGSKMADSFTSKTCKNIQNIVGYDSSIISVR
ncbi:hypothetical protein DPMN_151796 [Dreissena polymorpha]|uniref:Uncharacterized protein n=1 Tax=Dreissena polymorpha TaxID=45954 RepID=A0A9D4FG27_DREPO|nr:hypothetical protein DPMN_151796 [Dreissena polymorpha]